MPRTARTLTANTFIWRLAQLALIFLALAALPACQSKPDSTVLASDPPGAMLTVDRDPLGRAPQSYDFDFSKKKNYLIAARLPGYFDTVLAVTKDSPGLGKSITLPLEQDDAWTATTTSEATNTWLRIQVRRDAEPSKVWARMVSSVTSAYENIEMMEQSSMFIRSTAKSRSFQHPTQGAYVVRTQLIGAVDQTDPLVYKIKIVSNSTDKQGVERPYDRVFKEDAELVEELQGTLGIR